MMQIRPEVSAISTAAVYSVKEQSAMTNKFMNTLASVDDRIARVEEMLRTQADQIHLNQRKQMGSLYNVSAIPERQSPTSMNAFPTKSNHSEGLGVRVTPCLVACRRGCKCICHSQQNSSTPEVLNRRGYSVLRWALYGKQYKACEFLLHAGADPDYRPIAASDNSPRKKACHFLLEGGLSDDGADALHEVTKGGHFDDFIDEAKFTQTHRIVLGLSRQNLEQEIIFHPEDIDAQDAMGRTPLAWAAARGDRRAIVTLLGHGANPNIIDVQLSGPVSNAAAQGHTVGVRLLLEAGAHPDPPKPGGVKKGSPLNCAARNSTDVLLLKSLLDFGADVDSSGVDGKTALIHAARTDNASFAMLLLEYGADINATATGGSTPLTITIIYNSHNVLQLILD